VCFIVFSCFPCFHPLSCPTSYMSCCANWHHGWVRVFCDCWSWKLMKSMGMLW
jgi:hypothetical protein